MGKAAYGIAAEKFAPEYRLPEWKVRATKSTTAAWAESSIVRCMTMTASGSRAKIEEIKLRIPGRLLGSVRSNSCFVYDCTIFLMIIDDQVAKLVAVAEIDIQSQGRHALPKIGKLSANHGGDHVEQFAWRNAFDGVAISRWSLAIGLGCRTGTRRSGSCRWNSPIPDSTWLSLL